MRPTLAILFLLAVPASAAEPPPLPEYRAPHAATPPRIDGRLDDPAWAAAPLAGSPPASVISRSPITLAVANPPARKPQLPQP